MTATVWRHIIEMKMNQCLIIQIEAYWFENSEGYKWDLSFIIESLFDFLVDFLYNHNL